MKNAKKVIVLALCAILLVAASVMGTLAYLTDTESVQNTFTVGKVGISLTQATINSTKLVPGSNYAVNPVITVDADSEECWLVVKVTNELGEAITINGMSGWEKVDGKPGYYLYSTSVTKASAPISVFTSVTCNSKNTNDTLKNLDGKQIAITAYAIQKENVDKANVISYLGEHYTLN